MSRGPGIREIFSNQGLRKESAFKFEKQESKQQVKLSKSNDSEIAESSMKKYGGYKPKILGGQEDFLEIDANKNQNLNTAVPDTKLSEQTIPRAQPLNNKPWVIGDKDIPMVLGIVDDKDLDSNSEKTEPHVEDFIYPDNEEYTNNGTIELQRNISVTSERTLLYTNSDSIGLESDNPLFSDNEYVSVDNDRFTNTNSELADNTNKFNSENGSESDLPGVYIPAPDYDEDEKTLDFTNEDADYPNDGDDDNRPRQVKPKSPLKIYEGADLSHFLNEDEPEVKVDLRNDAKGRGTLGRNTKSEIVNTKSGQKQALYKQHSSTKASRKNKTIVPTFSSVRSFSYADSKFGTKGKSMVKSLSVSNIPDDGEIFLNSHSQQSSYESFLKSRHADNFPLYSSNADNGGLNNGDFRQSSKFKDDPVWKKLTLRIKRKISKSGKEQ